MGLFLRKFLLALNLGQFPALCRLYESLVSFVDGNAFSSVRGDEASDARHLTPRQLQLFCHSRTIRLEREMGQLSFEAVESEVQSILLLVPDLPRAFMLRSLNCALHNDQRGAFESLHKFFDFALRHG